MSAFHNCDGALGRPEVGFRALIVVSAYYTRKRRKWKVTFMPHLGWNKHHPKLESTSMAAWQNVSSSKKCFAYWSGAFRPIKSLWDALSYDCVENPPSHFRRTVMNQHFGQTWDSCMTRPLILSSKWIIMWAGHSSQRMHDSSWSLPTLQFERRESTERDRRASHGSENEWSDLKNHWEIETWKEFLNQSVWILWRRETMSPTARNVFSQINKYLIQPFVTSEDRERVVKQWNWRSLDKFGRKWLFRDSKFLILSTVVAIVPKLLFQKNIIRIKSDLPRN
jgi:hypothetical protein